MKRIFNSLGSNYSLSFAINALFSFGGGNSSSKLVSIINKRYGGETTLLYKGREAIKLSLDLLKLPKGSGVGINGFTCYVAYKAIIDAGCRPVLLDIDREDLNFSVGELESKGKHLKALIIQNTLGNPCDVFAIKKLCDDRGIYLIEDLAHSVGSNYDGGKEAGTVGDFTALSFSQDKMVDSVSGGALVIRNKKYLGFRLKDYKKLSLGIQLKDRLYPFLTFLIRNSYSIGLGKLLHFCVKKLGILSQPVSGTFKTSLHRLPDWYSKLAINRFEDLGANLDHRRMVARIYSRRINEKILSEKIVSKLDGSSNVRFPIFVKNRSGLINFLKKRGVYVSDIWYDAPIAPSRLIYKTDYNGECDMSEAVSGQILNLPTHVNVSRDDAEKISTLVNKWQSTNQK